MSSKTSLGPKNLFPNISSTQQQYLNLLVRQWHHEITIKNNYNLQVFPQTINAGKSVERREPSCIVGGNANWCTHYGEQYGGSFRK